MRFAFLLSLAVCGLGCGAARAGEPFHRVDLDSIAGYIVPESYATAHKAEIRATIPGSIKIDGFWTPGDTSAIVADRVLRETIHSALKDPVTLFPDLAPSSGRDSKISAAEAAEKAEQLERQGKELGLVSDNYSAYTRQYVGVIVDGERLIFCNYFTGTKGDPTTEYIFSDKYFVEDGKVHFLQCRFDREGKTCSHLSMIGPWGPAEK